ncbi:MAG: hypothetical protein RI560_09750 [Natronomonas sp.]|nr:hypothetical protein [Natronomonas sp.]
MAPRILVVPSRDNVHLLDGIVSTLGRRGEIDDVAAVVPDRRGERTLRRDGRAEYAEVHCMQRVHPTLEDEPLDVDRLAEIERRYGEPFLQRFVLADDFLRQASHDEQRRFVQHRFDFFEALFSRFGPDVLLTDILDDADVLIPFHLASRTGRALWWKSTRVGEHFGILENTPFDSFARVDRLFEQFKSHGEIPDAFDSSRRQAEAYVESFREREVRPGYYARRAASYVSAMYRPVVPRAAFRRENILDAWERLRGRRGFRTRSLPAVLSDHATHVYNQRMARWRNIFERPPTNEKYVFFPLHAQPEPSTTILAPMYLDQIDLLRQVSRSIPLRQELYVKEHPRMFRDNPRSIEYYRRLRQLPNVHLVHPTVSSYELTRNCNLLVTITGTAALEAVIHRKPAVTFGRAHFNGLSMVYEAGDPSDLSGLIDRAMTEHEHDEAELLWYMTALFAGSFELSPDPFSGIDAAQQYDLAEVLADRLHDHVFDG